SESFTLTTICAISVSAFAGVYWLRDRGGCELIGRSRALPRFVVTEHRLVQELAHEDRDRRNQLTLEGEHREGRVIVGPGIRISPVADHRGLAAGARGLEAPARKECASGVELRSKESRDVVPAAEPGRQRRHREARFLAQHRDDSGDVAPIPRLDEAGHHRAGALLAQRPKRLLL